MAEFDLDGNGMVASTEMSRKYELKFQTGQSQLLSTDQPVAAPGDGGGFRTPDDRSGPLWFQRMDRNRDGDVSWKEFLGKRAVFDRLDVDADGLINADESALAGVRSKK